MLVQSADRVPPTGVTAAEKLGRPECPGCGCVVLIAAQSRFSAAGRIDHLWSCDECGSEFMTSIGLWRR